MILKFKKGTQLYAQNRIGDGAYIPVILNQKLEENIEIDVPETQKIITSCGTQEHSTDKNTLVFYKQQGGYPAYTSLYLKCGDATNWPTITIAEKDIPKKYIISAAILLIAIINIVIYKRKHK